jgi:hypothetical protein
MYWNTMGCWARRRKFVVLVLEGERERDSGEVSFSMRAQVR